MVYQKFLLSLIFGLFSGSLLLEGSSSKDQSAIAVKAGGSRRIEASIPNPRQFVLESLHLDVTLWGGPKDVPPEAESLVWLNACRVLYREKSAGGNGEWREREFKRHTQVCLAPGRRGRNEVTSRPTTPWKVEGRIVSFAAPFKPGSELYCESGRSYEVKVTYPSGIGPERIESPVCEFSIRMYEGVDAEISSRILSRVSTKHFAELVLELGWLGPEHFGSAEAAAALTIVEECPGSRYAQASRYALAYRASSLGGSADLDIAESLLNGIEADPETRLAVLVKNLRDVIAARRFDLRRKQKR